MVKLVGFVVVSITAVFLAVLLLNQAFTLKPSTFLSIQFEIPVMIIGIALLWPGEN